VGEVGKEITVRDKVVHNKRCTTSGDKITILWTCLEENGPKSITYIAMYG